MNVLTIIVLVIVAIIALILIIALFVRKHYSVKREIIIDKPISEVFNYIRFLKNQDYYSKWVMTDPAMKKIFTGTDGQPGFIYAWDGNKKAGKGEQEIKKITDNEHIDVEVRFERPFVAIANTPFKTESVSGTQTRVIWGTSSQMKYPMNIMLAVMNIERMLGNDLEISLRNLKTILEK